MTIHVGNIGIAGYYTFYVNGEAAFEAPSKNLITNFGWNRILNLTAVQPAIPVVQVGTSNTPPALTDTALGGFVAQVNGSTSSGSEGTGTDANGPYVFTRNTYTFAIGAVVGNIAEVGWKVETADSGLTSRALVKDAGGNPTTLTLLSTDQLIVTFELRYYRAVIDTTQTVTIGGVSTDCVLRTAVLQTGTSGGNNWWGGLKPTSITYMHYGTGSVLGAAGVAPSGTPTTTSVAPSSFVADAVANTVTIVGGLIGTASGNSSGGVVNLDFSHTATVVLGGYSNLKIGFTPPIAKNNTKTLRYSFVFTFTRL